MQKHSCFYLIPIFIFLFCTRLHAQFENTTLFVQYDSAWTCKNLKLIPVRYKSQPASAIVGIDSSVRILSLSEAMRQKKIKVSELPRNVGADVSVLKLTNESKDYILVNSGEVIAGGKQDRAAGETVLLPPVKEDYYLKSYCVEKGRWSSKEKAFKYYKPADLSIKKAIDIEKNQAHVWNEIERQFKNANLATETWAYPEIATKNETLDDSAYIKCVMEKFQASDSTYAGFIAVTGNRIIATDLYANSHLTNNAFETILHSYVRFAASFGDTPTMPDQAVEQFMNPIFADVKTRREFLVRHGTMHYYQGKAIHLVAYGR